MGRIAVDGLAGIHELLGGVVVIAFIVTVILAAVAAGGGSGRYLRTVSLIAAGLLGLQYLVGLLLLGSGYRNTTTHYIIGLLVLVPVGLQHSSARRWSERTQGVAVIIWALAAAFLSILAYVSGMWGVA
jgi:hypothetical protein